MNIFFSLILYILFKYIFLSVSKKSLSESFRFVLPFSLFFNIEYRKQKTSELLKYICIELFLIISSTLVSFSFQSGFIPGLFTTIVATLLMYLSIYDIFTFSVPAAVTRFGLILVVAINIFALGVRLFSTYLLQQQTNFLPEWGTPINLLGGLLIGLIFWLIIKITKEEGLGLGDLDIVMIIGFTLGFPLILSAFYYTLITATIFGIILAIYLKKFKGLIIPFVPFLSLGYFLVIAFGSSLIISV